jgi:hypothetical protein
VSVRNQMIVQFLIIVAALTRGLSVEDRVAFPPDRGPATVDISPYPAPIRKAYKLFTEKCSACHTTARALNVTMSPDAWNKVVKQMAAKSTPRISEKEIRQILQFLLYDEMNRKAKHSGDFYPLTENCWKPRNTKAMPLSAASFNYVRVAPSFVEVFSYTIKRVAAVDEIVQLSGWDLCKANKIPSFLGHKLLSIAKFT